ncbi:MAG: hypothetical protein CVU42_00215 [Chloroflexi bacterium HGW-Chloroflexi-4]|jgi:hypothetical protein|nr:MAG: hypothetical protein CVU42_00215 [Chloroflexi bacterium HGW-Chloroflexi-4]
MKQSDTEFQIEITCYGMTAYQLKELLEKQFSDEIKKLDFSIKMKPSRFRTIDPATLVAIIGGSTGIIAALITGLINFAEKRKSQMIVLQGKDGSRIEIPALTPPEEIDNLIEKLKKMNAPQIFF